MALGADLLFDFLVEIVLMAGRTLLMPRPLKYHRALLVGYVAGITVQADFFQMVLVEVKGELRLFWGIGRGGATPSELAICFQTCTQACGREAKDGWAQTPDIQLITPGNAKT
jgi:hypothetical protein